MDKKSVGLRELGQNVSQVIALVKEGHSLVVTEHGRPVARIAPLTEGTSIEDLIAAGELIPAQGNVMDLFGQPIPEVEGITASEALKEMRDLEW